MQVPVVRDTRACDAADVPAKVEALRLVDGPERVESLRAQPMDLESLGLVEIVEVRSMPVRSDEQMTGRIRELVQQHERTLAAPHDEVFLVVALGGAAEDAALLLVGCLDVLEAPRRPQAVHR